MRFDWIEKDICCGCSACSSICQSGALTLKIDKTGFKYPQIKSSLCKDCGMCAKVCPMAVSDAETKTPLSSYAAYSVNNKDKESSSSGGIFSLLSKKVIEENGIVYGASFNSGLKVCHISALTEDSLNLLKGSKYCQSDVDGIFRDVKDKLISGKKVLFSGTPCQIAGLKRYLGKEYDELITVDVFCHGVPSQTLFDSYIHYMNNKFKSSVSSFSFREKSSGWREYNIKAVFENGYEYKERHGNDLYMYSFLTNFSLRESCFSCKYKVSNSVADISIGDFWGIELCYPKIDDNSGVSAVLIHTKKGQQLFDNVDNIYRQSVLLSEIQKKNFGAFNSVKYNSGAKSFNNKINKRNFEKTVGRYVTKTYHPFYIRFIWRIKGIIFKIKTIRKGK